MDEAKIRDEVLTLIYPVPTSPDSRYFHQDIRKMSEAEQKREWERVRLRLLLDPQPPQWLFDRLDAVEGVIHEPR